MGSYRKAIMTGFICRLCSEHKSVVIHLYGKRAKDLKLLEKIETLLPIVINKNDHFPKTICENCVENLCRQYDLVQRIRKTLEMNDKHHKFHRDGCPAECPLYTSHSTQTTSSTSSSNTSTDEETSTINSSATEDSDNDNDTDNAPNDIDN